MNTCSGCPARWTSHRTAHCGSCHRTFSTVSNFDRHRSPEGEHGHSDPSKSGFMAPEVSGELRDQLIEDVLTVALPIAWREWRPTATEPATEVSQ